MPDSHLRRNLGYMRHLVRTGGFAPSLLPFEGPINRAVGLIKDGIGIGFEFGPTSLERLVSVAELSEESVYERDSLHRTPSGVEFVLLNPPLRMGAYYAIDVQWDDSPVQRDHWSVAIEEDPPRLGSSIDRAHPFTFPVGVRSHVRLDLAQVDSGSHRVRMDFRNIAVPPRVWMDFHERVR